MKSGKSQRDLRSIFGAAEAPRPGLARRVLATGGWVIVQRFPELVRVVSVALVRLGRGELDRLAGQSESVDPPGRDQSHYRVVRECVGVGHDLLERRSPRRLISTGLMASVTEVMRCLEAVSASGKPAMWPRTIDAHRHAPRAYLSGKTIRGGLMFLRGLKFVMAVPT